MPERGAQYSVLCREDGGVLDDLFTYRLEPDRYLTVTNASNHDSDLAWFGRHAAGDMLWYQLAFDVTGDPSFPEKPAFEAARELGLAVTTHAGVWGATNDDGIRLMHEHDFMAPGHIYVHAATLTEDLFTFRDGVRPPIFDGR